MEVINFILKRLDNTTAWVGVICLCLLILNFHGLLAFIFIAMFFMPETSLTGMFKKMTDALRKLRDEYK